MVFSLSTGHELLCSNPTGLKPFFRAKTLWFDRGGEHCYDLCHGLFARIVIARFVKNASTGQAPPSSPDASHGSGHAFVESGVGEICACSRHIFLRLANDARHMWIYMTEQGIHRKLADLFYQVFLALNLERLSNGADRWLHMRIITDEQARGLGEVVYHACRAHMFTSVLELLCSLRFVELRIMFDQLAELLEDYRLAEELFLRFPGTGDFISPRF
jgi:hypothetical protein